LEPSDVIQILDGFIVGRLGFLEAAGFTGRRDIGKELLNLNHVETRFQHRHQSRQCDGVFVT